MVRVQVKTLIEFGCLTVRRSQSDFLKEISLKIHNSK